MRIPSLDLFSTFLHLRQDGAAVPVPWTPDFWRRLTAADADRVVGAKHGRDPGDFHSTEWEMHPKGDEILMLLSGALDVILELPEGERTVALASGSTCLVPRGIWHRLVMHEPSDLAFITTPNGTCLRPVDAR